MRSRQITFLIIAGLYLIALLIRGFVYQQAFSVVPGWHITLDYRGPFERGLGVLFFAAISFIYGVVRGVSHTLFVLHVIVSIVPLAVSNVAPFLIVDSTTLITYYESESLLELVYLLVHAGFLGFLYFKQWRDRVRPTWVPM